MSRQPIPFTLVAVHGNGGGAWRFERVKPFIVPGVRFLPLTLPGFGSVPRDPGIIGLGGYVSRLQEAIAGEPRPRVLLGHGIGASMLLELAQRSPEAADGLILHAPVGARLRSRRFPRLMSIPGAATFGRRLLVSSLLRPFWQRRLFSRSVPRSFLDRFFDEYRTCAVFEEMFRLITPDWFAALRPLALRSALLWGEKDRVLAVEQLEDYRPLLPGCQVRTVPGWDHFPMIEEPEAYAQEIVALSRQLLA